MDAARAPPDIPSDPRTLLTLLLLSAGLASVGLFLTTDTEYVLVRAKIAAEYAIFVDEWQSSHAPAFAQSVWKLDVRPVTPAPARPTDPGSTPTTSDTATTASDKLTSSSSSSSSSSSNSSSDATAGGNTANGSTSASADDPISSTSTLGVRGRSPGVLAKSSVPAAAPFVFIMSQQSHPAARRTPTSWWGGGSSGKASSGKASSSKASSGKGGSSNGSSSSDGSSSSRSGSSSLYGDSLEPGVSDAGPAPRPPPLVTKFAADRLLQRLYPVLDPRDPSLLLAGLLDAARGGAKTGPRAKGARGGNRAAPTERQRQRQAEVLSRRRGRLVTPAMRQEVALSLRALDEMGGGVGTELQLGSWPLVRTRTYTRQPGVADCQEAHAALDPTHTTCRVTEVLQELCVKVRPDPASGRFLLDDSYGGIGCSAHNGWRPDNYAAFGVREDGARLPQHLPFSAVNATTVIVRHVADPEVRERELMHRLAPSLEPRNAAHAVGCGLLFLSVVCLAPPLSQLLPALWARLSTLSRGSQPPQPYGKPRTRPLGSVFGQQPAALSRGPAGPRRIDNVI
ncbi:MAG: hypothetical protein WDW36_004992 [Sanguina aurantia]